MVHTTARLLVGRWICLYTPHTQAGHLLLSLAGATYDIYIYIYMYIYIIIHIYILSWAEEPRIGFSVLCMHACMHACMHVCVRIYC